MIQYGYNDIILPKINQSSNKIFTIYDFNKDLIKLINSVYHKDFIIFNYNML